MAVKTNLAHYELASRFSFDFARHLTKHNFVGWISLFQNLSITCRITIFNDNPPNNELKQSSQITLI